uniref:Transposon protein, putative, CACTA, En/Spm sub-class n=1 Tax=Oryza sativa subsp. japonica TaxID=39947 RepID=Q2QPQ9_ORYSJ|nr:transposon protein, putative, CACTA, En/Spm sub-class [Oryza sativa Japonica Group]
MVLLNLVLNSRLHDKFNTRFMDPRKVNTLMLQRYEKQTEDNIIHFLVQQHYKTFILLPYNTSFHCVILLFDLDKCKIHVYDSMDKPESNLAKIFEVIYVRENTTHDDFIRVVQEQMMGFINEQILAPTGKFYYDGKPIHQAGPSSSDLTKL